MTTIARSLRAPRGTSLTCKGWPQEAALRMLMNNLDPDVAERPDDLVVYGGTGKAARIWEAFDAIVRCAAASRRRRNADRAVGQAGRRLPHACRRAARAHRQRQPRAEVGDVGDVPRSRGSRADDVRPDDRRQLDLHRHAGHPAGHLRNAGRAGARSTSAARSPARLDGHRRPRRHGRRPAARGHDERRRGARRRSRSGAHRAAARDGLSRRSDRRSRRRARSRARIRAATGSPARSALLGNAAEVLPELVRRGVVPDVVTDQTSAHDPLVGLRARRLVAGATRRALRPPDPADYERRAIDAMGRHVARDARAAAARRDRLRLRQQHPRAGASRPA